LKSAFPVLVLMMLFLGTLTFAIKIQPTKAAATIVVPSDYSTIQAAINAANPGDTIYVRNGIYPEHIEVNKTVTLMGESNQDTIIEAQIQGSFRAGVHITSNNTIVEDFRIVPINSTIYLEIPTLIMIDGRLATCSNCTIRNCVFVFPTDVEAGSDAIDVYGSANNTITGNMITIADKSDAGIAVLVNSAGNIIDNNTITGGWVSITISLAGDDTVTNNYLTGQAPAKISYFADVGSLTLIQSSGDIVKGNTLINNTLGLSLSEADCSVYQNNFINNTQQALTDGDSQVVFDNGYPSGGNYWSDYNGTDAFSGTYQNRTGSDGIGDTPYIIGAGGIDHYPLMKPWAPHILGDINGDGIVDLKDLVLMACAYGSTPTSTNWDANADLDGNGRVDLTDLVTLATHYGQHYP